MTFSKKANAEMSIALDNLKQQFALYNDQTNVRLADYREQVRELMDNNKLLTDSNAQNIALIRSQAETITKLSDQILIMKKIITTQTSTPSSDVVVPDGAVLLESKTIAKERTASPTASAVQTTDDGNTKYI